MYENVLQICANYLLNLFLCEKHVNIVTTVPLCHLIYFLLVVVGIKVGQNFSYQILTIFSILIQFNKIPICMY